MKIQQLAWVAVVFVIVGGLMVTVSPLTAADPAVPAPEGPAAEPVKPAPPAEKGDKPAPPASQRAGCIANAFCDQKLDDLLLKSENIFDLYAALVGFLGETTSKDAPAQEALKKAQTFIETQQNAVKKSADAARPYRMPMAIDTFMKHLNNGAKGGASPLVTNVGDNPKARLYVASILPLLHLRGITYRLRPIASSSFVLHSTLIGGLRGLKQAMDVASGTNGRAIFHFLTYPMFGDREDVQFQTISDAQSWVATSFMPTLDHSIGIVEEVAKSAGAGLRESVNLQILMKAEKPFPNDSKESAFRWFGGAEVYVYLAQLYATRAALKVFCAWNFDQLPEATNELSNSVVKDFFSEKLSFGKPRIGMTSARRYQILEKYTNLFTLKSAEMSQAALADIRQAVSWFDQGMHAFSAAGSDDNTRVTFVRWVQAALPDYENKLAPQVRALVAGPTSLTDYFGGAVIDIDLAGFMQSPPTDLKVFFPEKFDTTSKYVELQSAGDNLTYTNYDYGRPLGWKAAKAADGWAKVFPNIKTKTNEKGHWEEPLVIYRDVSRTYVGSWLTGLLGGCVF
ncbi:MAG: hypothetical protein HY815_29825 [Candidatus Riflebacteria bacterium]|nr:hypothetical protein [Candidatus Riflebacteria bacterium]